MNKMLLIGGSNIDYIGTSDRKIIHHVSNIGNTSFSYGGVMRNVAENLARLGNKFVFITAVGNDFLGKKLVEHMENLGVELIKPETNFPTATYLAINDSNGDLYASICDNQIMDEINESFITKNKRLFEENEYIVIDSNLNESLIDYLFTNYKEKKFICEAISPVKVMKYYKHLKDIYLLKGNIHEAQAIANKQVVGAELINEIMLLGVKNIVVSNGPNDIYYGSNRTVGKVDVIPSDEVVSTTGCGDALFSGIVDKIVNGSSLQEAIIFGKKLSDFTISCISANSDKVSLLYYNHCNENKK